MAGYLDASGLEHFKRKNDAAYLGKREKAASAAVADSVDWENVSGRPDLSAVIPPGTIIHYAGRTVPSGYLICNGANVSRTDYAALFAAIGTIYGIGDGLTTFGLPNLNGRFLEGTTSTSEVGTYKSAGLPNITGRLGLGRSAATIIETTGVFQRAYLDGTTIPPTSDGPGDLKLTFSAANASSIYSGTTVQPRALASLVLIKF